ncbi:hypothetical protein LIER_28475 [Lithospermum erythrorhizon]|uniref:Uncharacterized protein n=1 Tax=Lithospermum erythrorhizon TaxID=34254 RepID=A0AAV3RJI5_LITER
MEEGDGNRLGKASTSADCNSRKVAEWNSKSLLQFNRRLQQKLYGDEAQVKPINVVYELLPKSKKKMKKINEVFAWEKSQRTVSFDYKAAGKEAITEEGRGKVAGKEAIT